MPTNYPNIPITGSVSTGTFHPIVFPVPAISTLLRSFNLNQRPQVIKDDNPYEGRVPAGAIADPALYYSPLGTPVVADITFGGGTYTDNETSRLVTFRTVQLATVLITVSRPKRIIKTEIQGRDGTVKEYIGMDDWQITINGIINGQNGVYPGAEVAQLEQLLAAPVTIPVISRYLQNLNIYSIVVTDYTFDQEPGGISKQNFTINCISDRPVELIIK